jgi:hypothetical protein
MASDADGSSWYLGARFLFAPVLVVVSPWPMVTTVLCLWMKTTTRRSIGIWLQKEVKSLLDY